MPNMGPGAQTIAEIIEAHPLVTTLIISVAACAIVLVVSSAARFKRHSLRALVGQEIRRSRKGGWLGKERDWFRALYYPSFASLRLVAEALALTLMLVLWRNLHTGPGDISAARALTEMQAKIALAFVSLMIFAVGLSLRSTASGSNLAEILLKESYLFPVALFVLGLFVESYWVRDPICAGCSLALVLLLAVFTFYRLARALLDESQLEQAGVELLKDKLRRSVELAVAERIGKNKVLEAIKDLPLEYSPFLLGRESDQYVIRALRPGVVHDIRVNKLVQFAQTLERISNENGYAYGDKRSIDEPLAGPSNVIGQPRTSDLKVEKRRYLMKLFLDTADGKYSGLFSYPRCLVQDEADRRKLEKLARAGFEIKKEDPFSTRLRRYLGDIKDGAISAIEGNHGPRLEVILGVYNSLLETFMDQIQEAGARYSLDVALREMHSLGGGWNEVTWIREQLGEVVYCACRTGRIDILRKVVSALFRMGYLAIGRRNHLVFLEITAFAGVLYREASQIESVQARDYVLGHSLEFLKGMADYVEIELRRPEAERADLDLVADLATAVLTRVHELFSYCIERGRLGDFDKIRQVTDQAFSGLLQFGTGNEIDRIKARLNYSPISEQDGEFYQAELMRLEHVHRVIERLQREKRELLFAVGGHVFKKFISSPDNQLASLNDSMSSNAAADPVSLTELLNSAYDPLGSARFGWQSWDALAERLESGGAYDPHGALVEYYCYCLVKLCQNLSDEAIERQTLVGTRDFVHEISEHGRIATTLSSFEDDRTQWNALIPDAWLIKLAPLRKLFGRVVAEHKRAEDDQLISLPISPARIQAFRDRFLDAFEKAATVRALFKRCAAFVDKSRSHLPVGDRTKWGLSLIEDKAAFVDGWHVEYREWGEVHGRDLAESESQTAFRELFEAGYPLPDKRGESLEKRLHRALNELHEEGHSPTVVLANLNPIDMHNLHVSRVLVPRWKAKGRAAEIRGFEGRLRFERRQIPMYRIRGAVPQGAVWIGDLSACAQWIQLPAADDKTEMEHLCKFFFLRIVDLGQDRMSHDAFLKSNPPWLASHEEKDRFLSQRAWLQALERLEIKVTNPKACRKFMWPDAS